jgi:hypothetical protein
VNNEGPSQNTENKLATPTGGTEGKSGISEIVQILLVALASLVLAVAGMKFFSGSNGHSGNQKVVAASATETAGTEKPGTTQSAGFVVINSDKIGAQALANMQKALKDHPGLLSHLGDVGRIVGADVNSAAQAYSAQGLLVYRAQSLLAYPPQADKTQVVQAIVDKDVNDKMQKWLSEPQAQTASPSPMPLQPQVQGQVDQPGFEP